MNSAAVTDPEQQTAPPRFWFPIHERKGRWLLLLCVMMLLLPFVILAYQILTSRNQPLVISKETTYITEPLTTAGLPDYAAALNARLGAGVTPETNAAVKLWEAIGPLPDGVDREYHAALAEALGMDPLPEQGDYLTAIHQWSRHLPDSPAESSIRSQELPEELSEAIRGPWQTVDHPELAAWLEHNEIPLQRIHEALQRPHYFRPMLPQEISSVPPGRVIDTWFPEFPSYREIAYVLFARAMWHRGEGRMDEAIEDLLDGFRLATKVTPGCSRAEVWLGMGINSMINEVAQWLLLDPQLTAKQAKDFREQLETIGPVMSHQQLAQLIDQGERLLCLDAATALATYGVADGNLGVHSSDSFENAIEIANSIGVNWNHALIEMNHRIDQLVNAYELPERQDQLIALSEWRLQIERDRDELFRWQNGIYVLLGGSGARGKVIGSTLISLQTEGFDSMHEAVDRSWMKHKTLLTGLALVEYRLEHGRYPADLQALIPDYLPEIPRDIFSGDPLIYHVSDDGQEMKIYSVGPDGVDHNGIRYNDPQTNVPRSDDIGVVDPIPQLPAEGEAAEIDADSSNGDDS